MTLDYTENDTKQDLNVSPEQGQTHIGIRHENEETQRQKHKLYEKLLKVAFCLGLRLIKLNSSNGMAHPLSSRAQDTGREGRGRVTGTEESNRPWLLSPPFVSAALNEKVLSLSHKINLYITS